MPGTLPTPPPEKSCGRMKVSSAVWLAGSERVGIAAERHRHLELAVGNLDVGAHGDVRLLVAARLDRFGAPDHRADILLALGIGRVLVIQHDALRHRRHVLAGRRLADAIGDLRPRLGCCRILLRFDHGGGFEQAAYGRDRRLAPQDAGADQNEHDADRNRALERKHRACAGARFLRLAVAILRQPRALTRRRRLRRLRRVTVGLLQRFVIRIGRVGIGAAVFHARLEPVEFRRGRRHVGIGLSRGAVGLRRGAAEIVGVGGDVAEAAHAGRLRRCTVFGAAARRTAAALAGRRWWQAGILHRNLRRLRTRRAGRRRIGAQIARRALFILAKRRTRLARGGLRRRTWALCAGRRARRACGFRRPGIGAAESVAAARSAAAGPACLAGALGGFRFDLAYGLFQRQPLAGDFGFGKRRLNAAQLRDQRGASPLIERTAALAWSIGVQAGDGARDQRVIISHFPSILQLYF